jgi:hypothetical protein
MSKIRNKYYKNFSKKNTLKFNKNKNKTKKNTKNKTKYNKKGGMINETSRTPGTSISRGQSAYIKLQNKFEKCNSELLHELNNIKKFLDVKDINF